MSETIVVAGGLAQRPLYAGHSWQFLQYLLGLRDLGWEVLFLDVLEPSTCVDECGRQAPIELSLNWRYFQQVMRDFGLEGSYSILYNKGAEFWGVPESRVLELTRSSAFLLNVMGFLTDRRVLEAAPRRVFLDTDPGIGQIWYELGLADIFAGHDDFVTIGENIGRSDCEIPTCGRKWITMRQPVVLDLWPIASCEAGAPFTSVVSWRGPFGPLEYGGKKYGLRVHEFRKFMDLPRITGLPFRLALDIDPVEVADLERLQAGHWELVSPRAVADEPLRYQKFLQQSYAEFMVAKHIYVETRGGWFSDRSTCYLASGKPVLVQNTDLGHIYPVGCGLLTFDTLEDVQAGLDSIRSNYSQHARAAREIAEAYFDSRKVFGRLLSDLGVR